MVRRQQRGGAFHEVPDPHEVVAALVVLAVRLAPGNGKRRDHGARERLVLVRQDQGVAAPVEQPLVAGWLLDRREVRAVSLPRLEVALPLLLERDADLLQQRRGRGLERGAEGEAERERALGCVRDLAGQRHVAAHRRFELPVEREVLVQVGPAVARSDEAARHPRKRTARGHGQPRPVTARRQDAAAGDRDGPRVVVPAADLEVRRAQRVDPQRPQQRRLPAQLDALQHARRVRRRDHLLHESVAAVGVLVGDSVGEAVAGVRLDRGEQVALLLVEEAMAVRDQQLQVARLWPVHARVVDLGDDAVPEREPRAARCAVRRADAVLAAVRPARLDPGRAERFVLDPQVSHSRRRRAPARGPARPRASRSAPTSP